MVNKGKSANIIQIKGEKNTSIDAEKALDNSQHSFMIKPFNKLGIEGNFLNLIEGIYEKHRANDERLKAFSPKIRIR